MSAGTGEVTSQAHAPNDASAQSADGLIDRLRHLQPLLRAKSVQGAADRRVSEESFQALRDAGAFKALVPKRYGGYELSMRKMLDVTSTVGEADGGTGWVVTLLTSCAWMVGGMAQQAQDDVWGGNPDAVVCGSVAAQNVSATPLEGGFRISGRWPYASGSWHVDWAMEATGEGLHVVDHPEEVAHSTALGAPFALFMAGAQLGLGRAAPRLSLCSARHPRRGSPTRSTPSKPTRSRSSCSSHRPPC